MIPRPDLDDGNGGSSPAPRCDWNERRIDQAQQLASETRAAVGAVASTTEHLHAWSGDFEGRCLREFEGLATQARDTETKLDRLLEGLAIGQVRATQVSRDWDLDEPTLHGREPGQAASLWRGRATHEATARTALDAQVATLTATLAERDRVSDRVHADRHARLRFWSAVIAAFLTSGGGVLLITKLLGG